MEHVDELNRKCPFTFSIRDDKISVHDKNEVAYVELTQIDNVLYIENSYTSPEFQKKYLNTCLRLLAAMEASKKGCILSSVATSAISLYTMVKLFPCTIEDMDEHKLDLPKTMSQCKELIDTFTLIRIETGILDYETLHQQLLETVKKVKGGTRKNSRTKVNRGRK